MPLTLPNLDDRTYDDLVAEALALIPALSPEWTNHNASDPGITLMELFAYLSEMLIYRTDQISAANQRAFLKLLNRPGWAAGDDLDADLRRTVLALRKPSRAVTPQDFELLSLAADARVARACCVPRRNLAKGGDAAADAPGYVSVVILARAGDGMPDDTLLASVSNALEPARLLTTRLQLVPPRLLPVSVNVQLWLEGDALPQQVLPAAQAALTRWLHPLSGGADGRGWPFGRAVHLSEVYALLDTLPGVDYVTAGAGQAELAARDARVPQHDAAGDLSALALAPDELPVFDSAASTLQLQQRRRS